MAQVLSLKWLRSKHLALAGNVSSPVNLRLLEKLKELELELTVEGESADDMVYLLSQEEWLDFVNLSFLSECWVVSSQLFLSLDQGTASAVCSRKLFSLVLAENELLFWSGSPSADLHTLANWTSQLGARSVKVVEELPSCLNDSQQLVLLPGFKPNLQLLELFSSSPSSLKSTSWLSSLAHPANPNYKQDERKLPLLEPLLFYIHSKQPDPALKSAIEGLGGTLSTRLLETSISLFEKDYKPSREELFFFKAFPFLKLQLGWMIECIASGVVPPPSSHLFSLGDESWMKTRSISGYTYRLADPQLLSSYPRLETILGNLKLSPATQFGDVDIVLGHPLTHVVSASPIRTAYCLFEYFEAGPHDNCDYHHLCVSASNSTLLSGLAFTTFLPPYQKDYMDKLVSALGGIIMEASTAWEDLQETPSLRLVIIWDGVVRVSVSVTELPQLTSARLISPTDLLGWIQCSDLPFPGPTFPMESFQDKAELQLDVGSSWELRQQLPYFVVTRLLAQLRDWFTSLAFLPLLPLSLIRSVNVGALPTNNSYSMLDGYSKNVVVLGFFPPNQRDSFASNLFNFLRSVCISAFYGTHTSGNALRFFAFNPCAPSKLYRVATIYSSSFRIFTSLFEATSPRVAHGLVLKECPLDPCVTTNPDHRNCQLLSECVKPPCTLCSALLTQAMERGISETDSLFHWPDLGEGVSPYLSTLNHSQPSHHELNLWNRNRVLLDSSDLNFESLLSKLGSLLPSAPCPQFKSSCCRNAIPSLGFTTVYGVGLGSLLEATFPLPSKTVRCKKCSNSTQSFIYTI